MNESYKRKDYTMTTDQAKQVADDLRTRINPAYATQLGTESYERRICAEAIEGLIVENNRLREALKQATKWSGKGSQVEVIARAALGE